MDFPGVQCSALAVRCSASSRSRFRRALVVVLHMAFCVSQLALESAAQTRANDIGRTLAADLGLEGRVMWIDGVANLSRTTNIEGVRDIVARCRQANISTIVVDVKPVVGQVLYGSKIADHLRVWQGKTYPDFDVLRAFVDEAHKAGIEVDASFNVFSEGHKYYGVGLAYRKRDWQSISYTVERSLVAGDGARLRVRGASESPTPGTTPVYGDEFVLDPAPSPGARLAVELEPNGRVSGEIDPALLGDEPLVAPENGRLVVLDGANMEWAENHLRVGDRSRFEAIGKRIPVTESPTEQIAAFVNPLIPEVRSYEISLMEEVARSYPVDGIVFDRMRYANLYNDYSDVSRTAFERWLGKRVSRWPDDVLQFNPEPGEPMRRGPLFKPWLEFRAQVIRDFLNEATERLSAVRPGLQFAVYVGSWYGNYYPVGVNWGSERFPVPYAWATPGYSKTGYAEFLDWISTGCYYPTPTRQEARDQHKDEGATVEAAADMSMAAAQSAAPLYAGIYALDYAGRPQDFARAIEVARKRTQGVMIFDLSYIYDYGWWDTLDKEFAQPAVPPHRLPGITDQLRSAEDALH